MDDEINFRALRRSIYESKTYPVNMTYCVGPVQILTFDSPPPRPQPPAYVVSYTYNQGSSKLPSMEPTHYITNFTYDSNGGPKPPGPDAG